MPYGSPRFKVSEQPALGLFLGIVIGERGYLDPDVRDQFMITGTVHLLSISGSHLGLVALLSVHAISTVSCGFRLRGSCECPVGSHPQARRRSDALPGHRLCLSGRSGSGDRSVARDGLRRAARKMAWV
jgi:hypothetical protein